MLGNFGAEDKGPTPEQARAFEAAMKKAGKTIDVKVYPGAGHAFANVNNPWGGYRKEAAEDAWARTNGLPGEVPEELARLPEAPRSRRAPRGLQSRRWPSRPPGKPAVRWPMRAHYYVATT